MLQLSDCLAGWILVVLLAIPNGQEDSFYAEQDGE